MSDEPNRDAREGDIVYDHRRISRPDASLPDWESPDTAYRPVPIVWFTGALLSQAILQPLTLGVFSVWLGLSRLIVVAVLLLVSGLIWHLAMARGLAHASFPWKVATGVMLASFFAFTALTALA